MIGEDYTQPPGGDARQWLRSNTDGDRVLPGESGPVGEVIEVSLI